MNYQNFCSISFFEFNCEHFFVYFIFYWILELLFRLPFTTLDEYFTFNDNMAKNEYIFLIAFNIADILSGFLVWITKHSSKGLKEFEEIKTKENNNKISLIYESKDLFIKTNYWQKIIIISFLDFISRSLFWIAYTINDTNKEENKKICHIFQKDMTISVDIFMRYIFSKFILKMKMFKHRIFSIIVMGIGFVILLIDDILLFLDNDFNLGLSLSFTGILTLRGIVFPLEHTLIKQIFSDFYLLPQHIQFLRGLIEMGITIVVTIIVVFSLDIKLDYDFDAVKIIFIILFTFAACAKAFILLRIIYIFSAQSVSFLLISETLGMSLCAIITIIVQYDNNEIVNSLDFAFISLEFIGVFLILFSTLVYDEIIVLNKWNLNENVKEAINERIHKEMKSMEPVLRSTVGSSYWDNKIDNNTENKSYDYL